MKIRIELKSKYRQTDCVYCDEPVHIASGRLPSWVNEKIGKFRFRLHRRTIKHKNNRPPRPWNGGRLAPAPKIDQEALQRRREEFAPPPGGLDAGELPT